MKQTWIDIIRNITVRIRYNNVMGSGVLLKSDDKTIVITAWHVLGNADEIDQKCLTIEQYQNNVLTELTLTVNEYELLKEVDIAVIHITTDCVVYEMNLCTPHYSGSVIVSGYPEVLSNNEKHKKSKNINYF